jgi:hypothetical protein
MFTTRAGKKVSVVVNVRWIMYVLYVVFESGNQKGSITKNTVLFLIHVQYDHGKHHIT